MKNIYRLLTLISIVLPATFAPAQTFTVLARFHESDGAAPNSPLLRDAAGNLYGTTSLGGIMDAGTMFAIDHATGAKRVLHKFEDYDGNGPLVGMVTDGHGNLYGTTTAGGSSSCNDYGCGTVFQLSKTGEYTVVHAFTGSDGIEPESGLLLAPSGAYGTTAIGGTNNDGVAFQINSQGVETVLYNFSGAPDGFNPTGTLIRDAAGNLYGTTYNGGIVNNTTCQIIGCGTVFELSPDNGGWSETVLYRFSGGADGGYPYGGLLLDAQGNLYGTTAVGGMSTKSTAGCGTIFELQSSAGSWSETVLHSFTGGADGAGPVGTLARDPAGNLFGAATTGGALNCNPSLGGCGTIFRLDPSNKFTVLHTFTGSDGSTPNASFLLDSATNSLYGTTATGGDLNCQLPLGQQGCGTVFRITER